MDNCQIKDSTLAHTIDIPLTLYTSLAAEHPPKIRRSLFAGVQYLALANAAIMSMTSFEFFQGVRKNTSNFSGYLTKTRKPLFLCFLIACRLGSPTFDSLHPVRSRRNKVGRGSLFYRCQSPINIYCSAILRFLATIACRERSHWNRSEKVCILRDLKRGTWNLMYAYVGRETLSISNERRQYFPIAHTRFSQTPNAYHPQIFLPPMLRSESRQSQPAFLCCPEGKSR